jgi:hypothetical protein
MLGFFSGLLHDYLLFDGKSLPDGMRDKLAFIERSVPGSMIASRARQVIWLAEEQAGAWVGRQLLIVDSLVEEKEYGQAMELLRKVAAQELLEEVRAIVEKNMRDVRRAEEEERQTQEILKKQAESIQWQKAVKLFEMRHFDEAIAAFSILLTSYYQTKAAVKIREAGNFAAAELRRDAAALFVKARKAGRPELSKEYMLESRRLLLRILANYPEADIIKKVKVNLKVLEEQLYELGNELVQEDMEPTVSQEKAAQPLDLEETL